MKGRMDYTASFQDCASPISEGINPFKPVADPAFCLRANELVKSSWITPIRELFFL
jgi:hypothetical protein